MIFAFDYKSPVILRDYLRIMDGKRDKIRDIAEDFKPEDITDVDWFYLVQEKDVLWTKELMRAYIKRWLAYSKKKAKKKDSKFIDDVHNMRTTLKSLLYNKLENNVDIIELVTEFNLNNVLKVDD